MSLKHKKRKNDVIPRKGDILLISNFKGVNGSKKADVKNKTVVKTTNSKISLNISNLFPSIFL